MRKDRCRRDCIRSGIMIGVGETKARQHRSGENIHILQLLHHPLLHLRRFLLRELHSDAISLASDQ